MAVGAGFEPAGSMTEAVRAAAANDRDALKRLIFSPEDGLDILATGNEEMLGPAVQAQQYEDLVDMLLAAYPVTVADLSGAIPALKRTVLNRAHRILVLASPTLSALRAARTVISEIKGLHGGESRNIELVITMQGIAAGQEVSKADLNAALELQPSAFLPFDPKLYIGAESAGKLPAQTSGGGAKLADQIEDLIRPHFDKKGGTETKAAPGGIFNNILSKLQPKS